MSTEKAAQGVRCVHHLTLPYRNFLRNALPYQECARGIVLKSERGWVELTKADRRRSNEGGMNWCGMVEVGEREVMGRSGWQEGALLCVGAAIASHAIGSCGNKETIEK